MDDPVNPVTDPVKDERPDRAMKIDWPAIATGPSRPVVAAAREGETVESREGEPVINRYRVELRHPDQDGTDGEVLAETEEAAIAQVAALAPEGSTMQRVVLMQHDYVEPEPPVEPPVSTDPTGTAWMASTATASGVASEPALFDDGAARR